MIKLDRVSQEPILSPGPGSTWEAGAVYNCAAVYKDDLVHLIYRATDITSNGSRGKYINSLGYAVSSDGIHFNRLGNPILSNDVEQEARGPEDPRIVEIDGTYHMMYTGFGGRFPGDYRISYATSRNLITWQRHGIVLDESNKDASLFPEKIGGKYILLHRRPPDIWMASSDDLVEWSDHRVLLKTNPKSEWENEKIGIAGPPIKMENSWLLIYHGVSKSNRYSLGIAELNLEDPTKVISRQSEPILEPELDWEINGHVPNVVFSCGQVIKDGELYVYYGAADTVIGVAKIHLQDIRFS
jgi:predicted GH43/DUF377 family glycosyl hydrolase